MGPRIAGLDGFITGLGNRLKREQPRKLVYEDTILIFILGLCRDCASRTLESRLCFFFSFALYVSIFCYWQVCSIAFVSYRVYSIAYVLSILFYLFLDLTQTSHLYLFSA
ncbi:hypothetical protein BGW36DRAFT_28843 [Talaromyces proteolyticus]|uniref:Uncharacterized protein n=1 Tax=Talaromyces proteolyticus TaxID=1131652 RepID=A0AAD4PX84_9EURO|nr:uncharacterized protein BGW36DRAFT_28843 [Talaromyces proteolyticus]KAH8692851.1 hypothetical protein BGW36DRAFT_28843 [Talaromyces proteolyticus]